MPAYGDFLVIAKLLENLDFRAYVEEMFPCGELSPNSTGVYGKVLGFRLTVLAGGRRLIHTMFLSDSLQIYQSLFSEKSVNKIDFLSDPFFFESYP